MAVAVKDLGTGGGAGNSGNHGFAFDVNNQASSWTKAGTITVTSGATLLVLCLNMEQNWSSLTGVTVTWDSGGTNQVMTSVGTPPHFFNTANGNSNGIWALVNPTIGAKSFNVAWTSGGSFSMEAVAITFSGTVTSSVAAACYGYGSQTSAAGSEIPNLATTSASIASGDMWISGHASFGPTSPYYNDPAGTTSGGSAGTRYDIDVNQGDNCYWHYGNGAGATVKAEADNFSAGDWDCSVVGIAAPTAAAAEGAGTPTAIYRVRSPGWRWRRRPTDKKIFVARRGLIVPVRKLLKAA